MKHDPARYLDEKFRNSMTTFSTYNNGMEIEKGIKLLKDDISSGAVKNIINEYNEKYSHKNGDYLFIVCEK